MAQRPDYWEVSYKRNILQRVWHDMRFRSVQKMLEELPDGADILDVGCGSGFTIGKSIPKGKTLNIYGVDTTNEQILHSRKNKPSYHFKVGYAEKLPYEKNKFEAVTYLDVIEHVKDPLKTLQEAHRVLKDKGFVVVEVVKEHHLLFRVIWWVWTRLKGKVWHGTHLYVFDEKSLVNLLKNAGFRISKVEKIQLGMGLVVMAHKRN